MIKTLRPYLKGYGKYLLLCMFVMMFEGILEMMLPYFMSQIVNVGVMNKDLGFVVQKGLIMVSLALGSLLAGILGAVLSSKNLPTLYISGYASISTLIPIVLDPQII